MENMEFETLLLSKKNIKNLITMKEVVDIVDKTFKGFGDGTVVNPSKVNLDLGETSEYPPYKGFMNAMPAYIGWLDSAGIKWAGGFLGKRKDLGLEYVTSMILLINPEIGNFVSAMDGAHITNMRTGAQAAVAANYFHKEKDITIGLYGAGMQGHTQTIAMAELFNIKELRIYDINMEASKNFKEDMKDIVNGDIIICDNPKEAAQGDIVVSFTQSKDKFIKYEWLKPGTIVFPMGSYQEVEDEVLLKADKIIVDHIEQCLHRGALANLYEEGNITEENIFGTIGELAINKIEAKESDEEIIVCIPIGTGAMDISVATYAYKKALKENIGEKFIFA